MFSSLTPAALASQVLYGGVGNASSTPGAVVTIDQSTGARGHGRNAERRRRNHGPAFNSQGQLYATVSPRGGSAFLEQIDPVTFAEIGGDITLSADPNIGDLAFQPKTDIL